MAIPLKYDSQLIAMVTGGLKARLKAESDARQVSLSQVTREYLELGIAMKAQGWGVVAELADENVIQTIDGTRIPLFPDPDTARDAEEQLERNRLDELGMDDAIQDDPDEDDRGPSLAEFAARLTPDTEPDDVDEVLSDGEARLARLQARGLI